MSIYLFKTEDYYGGETRVFLSKVEAEEYRTQFIERTNSRTDAIIEEHKPFPVVHVRRNNGEVDPKPILSEHRKPATMLLFVRPIAAIIGPLMYTLLVRLFATKNNGFSFSYFFSQIHLS